MKVDIDVSGDIDKLLNLDRQIQFATAATLTQLAKESQAEIRPALRKDFTIRGDWDDPKKKHGIKVKTASKNRLEAAVYTSADWLLEAHGEHGGVKTPDGGGQNLAIPSVENTRHGIQNKIRPGEKARKLLNNAPRTKAFKVKSKRGTTLIMQRVGLGADGEPLRGKRGNFLRGRGKNVKTKTILKYALRPAVKVPQHPVITETTRKTVFGRLNPVFEANLRKAIETAK